MKPHYDVLIATPGKLFHAEYVDSLVATTKWLAARGLSYKLLNKQSSFIPSGRELTATDTYSHNWETREIGSGAYTYSKIVWIDSDIQWDVKDFVALWSSDFDVVGGMYQTAPDGTVAVAKFDSLRRPIKVRESEFILDVDPVEVFGVGFGFVAMKYGVFESCSRPWFRIRGMQWDELDFEVNVGEDYSWCMNARESGFKVMLDPKIRVKHHKETVYELPPTAEGF
jgi:hypothetical protein